jgi:hypothetical protein
VPAEPDVEQAGLILEHALKNKEPELDMLLSHLLGGFNKYYFFFRTLHRGINLTCTCEFICLMFKCRGCTQILDESRFMMPIRRYFGHQFGYEEFLFSL